MDIFLQEKNSVNAIIKSVRIIFSPRALKSLNSIEKIQPRMMHTSFNSNLGTTIVSCYSPTNVTEETDIITFYNELPSFVRHIPKHNILIIGGDVNAQISSDENKKFYIRNSSNRNREHLADFSLENRQVPSFYY